MTKYYIDVKLISIPRHCFFIALQTRLVIHQNIILYVKYEVYIHNYISWICIGEKQCIFIKIINTIFIGIVNVDVS